MTARELLLQACERSEQLRAQVRTQLIALRTIAALPIVPQGVETAIRELQDVEQLISQVCETLEEAAVQASQEGR